MPTTGDVASFVCTETRGSDVDDAGSPTLDGTAPDAAAPAAAPPTPDAAPLPVSIAVDDMDVANDGSLVVVHRDRIECFDPGLVAAAAGPRSWPKSYPQIDNPLVFVSRSRVTKTSTILSRVMLTADTFGPKRWVVQFVNADCSVVTSGPELEGDREFGDLEVDDMGRTVVITEDDARVPYLRFFDASGALVHTLEWTAACNSTTGIHVSLDKTTGDGVATCQSSPYDPIYFRRFRVDGTWKDATSTVVDGTSSNAQGVGSSSYDTHIVGMNDSGRFGVMWTAENTLTTRELAFYDEDAHLVSHTHVSAAPNHQFDEYRGITAKAQRSEAQLHVLLR